MQTEHLIALENVNKTFSGGSVEVQALRAIDLTINDGDFISITGPSGAGKSSLLAILGLLDTVTSGKVIFCGQDTQLMSFDQRADLRNCKIGYVFQSFNLIDELNVYDNVALPLQVSHRPQKPKKIDERVKYCLSLVELGHLAQQKPHQLSGGQQQRVAIARALVNEPNILLVDEPTGNLDSQNGERIMSIFEQLNRNGHTICMVTHDLRYAKRATKHIYIADGVLYLNPDYAQI